MPDDSFLPFVRLRMRLQIGQLDAASQALDEAMNYFDAVENPARRSAILGYRAMIAFYRGADSDAKRARAYLFEALTLAHKSGDVKLTLEGLAVWGSLRRQESADPLPGARLLAKSLVHPALAQEVRDQVESVRSTIPANVWDNATAWATDQTSTSSARITHYALRITMHGIQSTRVQSWDDMFDRESLVRDDDALD